MVRWEFLRSTTLRVIALLFACQLALAGGLLFFVNQSSHRTLLKEQKELVAELRDGLVAEYKAGGEEQLESAIDDRLNFSRSQIAVILLTTRDGQPIAGNIEAWPTAVKENTNWQTLELYRTGSNVPENIGFVATSLPNGSHLLTGHVIDSGLQLLRINSTAGLAAFLLALPLSFVFALALGRIINGRIARIADTTDAVGTGDFSHRVSLHGGNDAFDRLGHNVNDMLDRIEALISELRMVTDGLAHDLRSPVTRLKSVIERAVIEVHDPAALSALEKVSAEADYLQAMLTTALQISRAQTSTDRDHFVEMEIDKFLADLVEVYGPLVEDQGFTLSYAAPTQISLPMHRELLSQALGNLIENALKYAEGGDRINLVAQRSDDGVTLTIDDNGIGIPAERFAEAMKRFGRLDPARTKSGSGLGLSLVDAIVRMHGGTVRLADNGPGLRVILTLPMN